MKIDKSQFYQVFFEETGEHLVEMERLLINLDINAPHPDDLNAIFRAAHSIKGASSTFGFQDLSQIAHSLETALDKIRNGGLKLKDEMLDLFLQAGDLLKIQLAGHRDGIKVDPDAASGLCGRLEKIADEESCDQRNESGGQESGIRSQEESLDSESSKQRANASVEGEAPKALPLEGATQAPVIDPGYGFFEDIYSDSDTEKRSKENSGRRATDNPDTGLELVGRRASDRSVNKSQTDTSSIRVSVNKVDQLINQVGELVITQAMLAQTAAQVDAGTYEKLQHGLAQLERNTRDLQESVMGVRMMPISFAFGRFPRLVRDMAGKLNKEVELRMIGEETELDKGLIEKLVDPLTHLVRNSLDHGIESLEERIAAGKDPKGVITLRASHEGGNVIVEVSDDGSGLNREKILAKAMERGLPVSGSICDQEVWQLIFAPGFSTAEVVTDVSGRGVGMDVVKRNVQAIGGRVEIQSKQRCGSRFIIRLPLTLAIIEGMIVRVGYEVYIVPLISIIESIRPKRSEVKTIVGRGEVVEVHGEYVKITRLYRLFGVASDLIDPTKAVLVIAESAGEQVAILVDELVGKQQVVIKSIEQNFQRVDGIAGATILGDGQVAFILDIGGLLALAREKKGIGVSM
ncbi:MAG: chemotaxis protein CheW [Nitrospirae bacterium]|nr:chemotaxis protein CheW [Nitrospirota bacterium]